MDCSSKWVVFRGCFVEMVVVSLIFAWKLWFFIRLFVEVVVFSLTCRRNGVLFVNFSSKWRLFRGCFVEMVVFSLIFRRNGSFFVDFSSG